LDPRDRVPIDHCDGCARATDNGTGGARRPKLAADRGSLAASALVVVFLLLPWGNASFLMAIVTLFGWIAAVAARLTTHHW
jgi:hypothetical protein